ncbi:hypothetical protein CR513_28476, partial [Mucuna pruriens]
MNLLSQIHRNLDNLAVDRTQPFELHINASLGPLKNKILNGTDKNTYPSFTILFHFPDLDYCLLFFDFFPNLMFAENEIKGLANARGAPPPSIHGNALKK